MLCSGTIVALCEVLLMNVAIEKASTQMCFIFPEASWTQGTKPEIK